VIESTVDRQKSRRLIDKRADGRSQQEPMVDPNRTLPALTALFRAVLLAGSASLLNAACCVHFVLQTHDLVCVCVLPCHLKKFMASFTFSLLNPIMVSTPIGLGEIMSHPILLWN
jgi:hypothetical protein